VNMVWERGRGGREYGMVAGFVIGREYGMVAGSWWS
jgi:hypothetical protein